ncbi:MAG: type I polyketide synthase, partial [Planctomycetes bacterium]|nr:type I polyketide synthase [Planctomycetota bacterium]
CIQGQVALGTFASDVLESFGAKPQAVIGYSLGETTGLFATRTWRARDEMWERMEASTLFTRDLAGECESARRAWNLRAGEAVDWCAGVLERPAEIVRGECARSSRAYVLIANTPGECVIGGERAAVAALAARLGTRFHELRGVTSVHCEAAAPVAEAYRALHLFPATPPAGIDIYSAAWARRYEPTRESAAESILAQALHGFDFSALVEQAYADGARIFVELGPGQATSRMIGKILGARAHRTRAFCTAAEPEFDALLAVLALLIAERVPVDLAPLYGGAGSDVEGARAEPARRTLPVAVRAAKIVPGGARAAVRQAFARAESARGAAHESYLRFAEEAALAAGRLARASARAAGAAAGQVTVVRAPTARPPRQAASAPRLDRAKCLEFATGSIARVLGAAYAAIDRHPTRVRLPAEPLMLADRILEIEGEPLSLGAGRVVTEHDVGRDPWYLDCGVIPTGIAVESGQADLFLSAYLGIDRETRGLAVYRLLDAVVTFHDRLPGAGDVIRYDIAIERFFRQGETWLFRFRFDATVGGRPLLSMRDGCAGFFTAEELAAGRGIVRPALEREEGGGGADRAGSPALAPGASVGAEYSYGADAIDALRRGDLARGFGADFAGLALGAPETLPAEPRLLLVDRVVALAPSGGPRGLGSIAAELDINPDDWFLVCHFADDRVMPGTLMYECCLHTLRILLLRRGWVAERGRVRYEPVPGVASRLKCRGQVTASTRTVRYEVTVKEIGYRPEPYAIADAIMLADGKPIVEMTDMSVRLAGTTREELETLWRARGAPAPRRRAIFDRDRILAFAIGKPSDAFGEPYRVFDEERVIARLPGPPYQFLDRIVRIDAAPWVLRAGAEIEAEYDLPADAWYFASNRQERMPYAVLLEIALQPCGWLAAYLGSALTSEVDLSFRNLGGNAVQLRAVAATAGTLATRVRMTSVSQSGGMIIQHFDFEIRDSSGVVFRGDTYFGFFSKQALAEQVGLRGSPRRAIPTAAVGADAGAQRAFPFPAEAPFPDDKLRLLDEIDALAPAGGERGLGALCGSFRIDPDAWFFKAHFYQDPVVPGSLGLESFIQLLKAFASERWGASAGTQFEAPAAGVPHRWSYRGQILPANRLVTVEAEITALDERARRLTASGLLAVDGLPIYQMADFTLAVAPAGAGARR